MSCNTTGNETAGGASDLHMYIDEKFKEEIEKYGLVELGEFAFWIGAHLELGYILGRTGLICKET